jgi:RNA polymerase sigma-70 factor (ECF subfamily)
MFPKTFADEVVEHSSKLRGYARRLAGNRPLVDDLVQDTILRALVHSDQFKAGTNLSAWLHTILRNSYFNEVRRAQRFCGLSDDAIAGQQSSFVGDQVWVIQAKEVAECFAALPSVQRQALALVALDGDSYEAAALKMGCPPGTIKSRVSRGRVALSAATAEPKLNADREKFFGYDLNRLNSAA